MDVLTDLVDTKRITDTEMRVSKYGPKELEIGVAANRETQGLVRAHTPTEVYYNDSGGTISIDLENDPGLYSFLSKVKDSVRSRIKDGQNSLGVADLVASEVVHRTPKIDETGEYHQIRQVTLGEALNGPVECVDRALAMEASLKMFGFADAKMLIGVDNFPDGAQVNHTDVVFSSGGVEYVAITMGKKAGQVVTKDGYIRQYLPQREASGLGKRVLRETWSYPYFEVAGKERSRPESLRAPVQGGAETFREKTELSLEELREINQKLEDLLEFDEYNARAVARRFYELSKTPGWEKAWQKFEGLMKTKFGMSLEEKVEATINQRTNSEPSMGKRSVRALALEKALTRTELVEKVSRSMSENASELDNLLARHVQLRETFNIKRAMIL